MYTGLRIKLANVFGIILQMQEVHLGHDPVLRKKSVSYLKKEMEIDYHEVDINTLYNRYGSHPINVCGHKKIANHHFANV
jgi:hypothetical protein